MNTPLDFVSSLNSFDTDLRAIVVNMLCVLVRC